MKNREAVRRVTRSNGYSYLLFRYRRGEHIKIVPPSPKELERMIAERDKAVAAMNAKLEREQWMRHPR